MSGIGVIGVLAAPGSLLKGITSNNTHGWLRYFLELVSAKALYNTPDALEEQAGMLASAKYYAHHNTQAAQWYTFGNGAYAFPVWVRQHPTEGLLNVDLPVYHTTDNGQNWQLLTTLSNFQLEAFARMDWGAYGSPEYLAPAYAKHPANPVSSGFDLTTLKGHLNITPRITAAGLEIQATITNHQNQECFKGSIQSVHLSVNHFSASLS